MNYTRLPPVRVTRTSRPSIGWLVEILWTISANKISIRYKESLIGFGWVLLQPTALTLIFVYIRKIADIPTGGIPYPLFVATGLVAWSFSSLVTSQATISLTGKGELLKRIPFPKALFPISCVITSLADLAIMCLLVLGLLFYYQTSFSWNLIWLPFLFAIHVGLVIGIALLFSLANILFRDLNHATPHLLQLWFFISPVFYPYSLVPGKFEELARWNPIVGLIESYRAVLLTGKPPPYDLLVPAILVSGLILSVGSFCFWKLKNNLADLL